MLFDFIIFLVRQDPRLVDDLFADKDLSDIVQHGGKTEPRQRVALKSHGDTRDDGQNGDIDGMHIGVIVEAFQIDHVDHHILIGKQFLHNAVQQLNDASHSCSRIAAVFYLRKKPLDPSGRLYSELVADDGDDVYVSGQIIIDINAGESLPPNAVYVFPRQLDAGHEQYFIVAAIKRSGNLHAFPQTACRYKSHAISLPVISYQLQTLFSIIG